ncbi:MAG: hypothetical protein H6707_21585 [Deltaproteobacteria bacterium]|nr:hypothetical protein [Deltaproteobacteria bacterium]
MNRLLASIAVAVGVALIALGLLFLVAAIGTPRRLVVAAVGLALGAVSTGFGLRAYRRSLRDTPLVVRGDILALARRQGGEISAAEIAAEVGARGEVATAVLSQMVKAGICQRIEASTGARYLFESLKPQLIIARCEYCQAELPLNQQLDSCPRCGGTIATRLERRDLQDDKLYRMDEPH